MITEKPSAVYSKSDKHGQDVCVPFPIDLPEYGRIRNKVDWLQFGLWLADMIRDMNALVAERNELKALINEQAGLEAIK